MPSRPTRARPLAAGGRTRAPVGLALLTCLAACHRGPTGAPPVPPRANPAGTLPQGCAVVATVNVAASAAVGVAVRGLIDGMMATQLDALRGVPGVELAQDVKQVTLCKFDVAGGSAPFVMLVSGARAASLFDAATATGGSWQRSTVAGVAMVSRGRVWGATRATAGNEREVVWASDAELLRQALVGPPGAYQLERALPFSAIIGGAALAPLRAAPPAGGPSGLESVQQVRLSLLTDSSALTARLILGDRSVSDRLASALVPFLGRLAQQMVGARGVAPRVSAENVGGDVVATIALPSGSLEGVLASFARGRVPRSSVR